MQFNNHSDLSSEHALLSPSKYQWTNYNEAKLTAYYLTHRAAREGTETHEFAKLCILRKQKLPNPKLTLDLYVNDSIGWRMNPEVVLYYSPNAFGTCDAISFREDLLRINDLKTGTSPVSMRQLEIYTALFCLEYAKNPKKIRIELRLYQSRECLLYSPDPIDIKTIMDKIKVFDAQIEKLKSETEE